MPCSECKMENEERFYQNRNYILTSLAVGLVCLVLSLFWHDWFENNVVGYFNPAWIPIVMCGIPLFAEATESLFVDKKIKSALLISVAMLACIALEILEYAGLAESGEHSHNLLAAGEIAFLMMIGELLEDITVAKSRKGIEALYSLAPDTAEVKLGNEYTEFPVSYIKVGDLVRVLPYQKISVDGVIVAGTTSVNQSAITGESVPVDKTVGDEVYAGTFNESKTVEIKVTRASTETVVSKMIAMVKESEEKKAPIARIADRWAKLIVPLAMGLSVVVFFLSKLIFQETSWSDALVRAVTVLVVFCPCSLALATPTAISAGIGNASFKGVLIKSGEALEKLAGVDTVVFDKTGTLTKSEVCVSNLLCDMNENEFVSYAGSCEQNSDHPLAKAITSYCKKTSEIVESQNSETTVGAGVSALVDGKKVEVKKYLLFESDKYAEEVLAWQQQGKTVVGVGIDGQLKGVIALSDEVRQGSALAVKTLNEMGVNTVMLTGDNENTAQQVASSCGIREVRHSLLPEEKVEAISEMKMSSTVLMVGDGVNDAPSLAEADCSLAMGGIGSDASLEVADMVLMNDKIEKIPFLLKLSKKTLATIKRNIVISMTINLASVVLSFFGILNPALGAVVHNCSSVFVVFSSTLLLSVKDNLFLPQSPQLAITTERSL